MILGAEIGMIVIGIIALVKGKLTLSKKKVVYGTPARFLAIITFMPLPTAFVIGAIVATASVAQGRTITQENFRGTAAAIEAAVVIFYIVLLYAVGNRFAVPSK
jgi:hypothetical protein